MEYAAAGQPIIVPDRPALRRLIETYQYGVCTNEQSPESIAVAVSVFLGDPDLAQRPGQERPPGI